MTNVTSKFGKLPLKHLSLNRQAVKKMKNQKNLGGKRLFCCWYFQSRQVTLSRIAVGNQLAGGKRSAAVLYSISDAADYNPTTNRKDKSISIAAWLIAHTPQGLVVQCLTRQFRTSKRLPARLR